MSVTTRHREVSSCAISTWFVHLNNLPRYTAARTNPSSAADPSSRRSNINAQFQKTSTAAATTSVTKNVIALHPVWHGRAGMRRELEQRSWRI